MSLIFLFLIVLAFSDFSLENPFRPLRALFAQNANAASRRKIKEKRALKCFNLVILPCDFGAQGKGYINPLYSATPEAGKRQGKLSLSVGFRTACKTLSLFS
jgi:hypothetical protein